MSLPRRRASGGIKLRRSSAAAAGIGNWARWLALDPPPFVLCHADIHTANIIVDPQGEIRIVDWDETLIAPKERDLMFFVDDGHKTRETDAFFAGYDGALINWLALAYYKYDWVVQEFADYGERIFLSDEIGGKDLDSALREFQRLFEPDDVIDRAHRCFSTDAARTCLCSYWRQLSVSSIQPRLARLLL